MFLHGEVINSDTSWKAPEGTLVIVRTDKGEEFQDTVDSNGRYGEPASDRLVVQECNSFEIFVKIGDSEISMGNQKWQSGAVEELELRYSLKDMQGEIIRKITPTTYPSRGRTVTPPTESPEVTSEESNSIVEGSTKAGTGEVQSSDEELTSTSPSDVAQEQEHQNTVESPWWQQPTASIMIVAVVIGIIAAITYLSRK
jgi:hypothetical protein